jgi:hypothetical protein
VRVRKVGGKGFIVAAGAEEGTRGGSARRRTLLVCG